MRNNDQLERSLGRIDEGVGVSGLRTLDEHNYTYKQDGGGNLT